MSTGMGCTGSPSVAMTVRGWFCTVSCTGHTEAIELIILKRYLLPGVMVKISSGVLVLKPVLASCNNHSHFKTLTFAEH